MRIFRRRLARAGADPRRDRRRRWRRRLVRIVLLFVLVAVVGPAAFIGVRCTGSGSQSTAPLVTPVPMPSRDESFTYLTLPEWSIVYSTEEYARHLSRRAPSQFPYFGSALQYWRYVDAVCQVTRREYPFATDYQIMLGVIGSSFSVELVLKGLYEKTLGRATEWLATTDTPEDRFAASVAREYGAFMNTTPWFEFPFGQRLRALWVETPIRGPHLLRKIERRAALTAEYGAKAVYGWLIGTATRSAYAPEDLVIRAWITQAPDDLFSDARIVKVHEVGPGSFIVTLPRYHAFTGVVQSLAARGVQFLNIAGNDEILVTAVAARDVTAALPDLRVLVSEPLLAEPPKRRVGLRVPVAKLTETLRQLQALNADVEHVYDY